MDFSIFDHREHMMALTWLGRKDWMLYKDIPNQRAIAARPRKLIIKPKQPIPPGPESPIVVGETEYAKYPTEMWDILQEIMDVLEFEVVGTLWYNTLAKALAGGPKIFRPTAMQCAALEHSEARFAFKDYKQPFPVITLEIPQEYRTQLSRQYGIDETPQYVLVNHDDKNRFITVSAFYSKNNIITHITPDRTEYKTIEQSLTKNRERRQDEIQEVNGRFVMPGNPAIQGSTISEFDAAENVQRLGINFAMMMSLYTVKDAGKLDPSNYKVWLQEAKAVRKGKVPTRRALEAQQNLAAAMSLIQFDQNVSFYDEIEQQVEVGIGVDIEKLHKSPKSHWRRGHFAMQPCGIGRRNREVIFRKPLFVRAKYFLGDVKDTSVTYTILNRDDAQPQPAEQSTIEITPPELLPELKIGRQIEVVQAENCPAGTRGSITKIIDLGTNMMQINAKTDDGQKFSLFSPPDEFLVI